MTRDRHFLMVFLGTVLLACGAQAESLKLRLVAPEFVPLQTQGPNGATGYVVELVQRMIERVGAGTAIEPGPVEILPFRRAMAAATSRPNVLLFSISRTPAREPRFQWVGEVSPYEVYFFKLRRQESVAATSISGLKNRGYRIGVQAGSNTEELLKRNGFVKGPDYVTYSNYRRGINMLFNDRFDMLPLTSSVGRANICREGYRGEDVQRVMRIDEISNPLWMVASKGTSAELIGRLQKALKSLKEDGTANRIQSRYLSDHLNQSCAGK